MLTAQSPAAGSSRSEVSHLEIRSFGCTRDVEIPDSRLTVTDSDTRPLSLDFCYVGARARSKSNVKTWVPLRHKTNGQVGHISSTAHRPDARASSPRHTRRAPQCAPLASSPLHSVYVPYRNGDERSACVHGRDERSTQRLAREWTHVHSGAPAYGSLAPSRTAHHAPQDRRLNSTKHHLSLIHI